MRTPQLSLFFLLLVCQTTESLTDKQVNLGQNVTLDCQIDVKEIYWVFQKLTDSPVLILRTFTSGSPIPLIYDERFKDKYSSLTLSWLFISNVTIDELGIYYCVKTTGSGPQLSNGTRLYINITESAQDHNQTENKNQPQCEKTLKIDNRLTVTSFLLNIVLIIATTGLLIHKFKKSTKSRQYHQNVEPEQLEDFNTAQYSEIELPTYSREENPKQINGTYVLLQKPKSHPRVQHNVNLQSY
ncbi:uncharacterized protein LOC125263653 [Megalobrama amblycephala]|uniref:uncharacterized protein LOC125263653 n=1 Tax=Megalobrama amblycephala TaxID=75352 RepID=UPI002013DB93|nr:uncharacterized protein LOC125263653 [Megalobrama amblycephala]